jgi:hypothetical protein
MMPLSSTAPAGALYTLDSRTRDLLVESAPLMEEWSASLCCPKHHGGMEEWAKKHEAEATPVPPSISCDWYHGTWQYLRLLNMVAVPAWYEFYNEALSNVLRRRPQAQILISAAADYGMLAQLHEAIEIAQAAPRIVVYDICHTPLRSCQWYADRHGLEIECHAADLLACDIPEAPFDLIVTDEFLTVINSPSKPRIVSRWRELLKPGGTLVTTAMVGGATTPELRRGYAERAWRLQGEHASSYPQHQDGRRDELLKRCALFAGYHTRHMLSGEAEVRALFDGFGEFSYVETVTPGECVNPTHSFQIVATAP